MARPGRRARQACGRRARADPWREAEAPGSGPAMNRLRLLAATMAAGSPARHGLRPGPDRPGPDRRSQQQRTSPAAGRARRPARPPTATRSPRATRRGSSRRPTASSRCSTTESTAAARPWCCPNSPKPQNPLPDHRHPPGHGGIRPAVPPARRARCGSSPRSPPSASPWLANGEEVLDTEMVHAIAPGATIVEVLVNATSLDNTAERGRGRRRLPCGSAHRAGGVISISAAGQTGGEHCDTHAKVTALHAALQKRRQPPRDGGRRLRRHRRR